MSTSEKRLFQALDEMNLDDIANGTRLVGVCNAFLSAGKVKGGGQISMGVPEEVLYQVLQGSRVCILVTVDKEEYFKRNPSS